jgi:hypothetical protein
MTNEQERIVAALERGQASAAEQREAARMIRDLDHEVEEISELNQRG